VGNLLDVGLSIEDCAKLATVSKDTRVFVSTNACWREAYAALDQDFHVTSPTEFTLDYRPYPGDPRADPEDGSPQPWEDRSPMYRFGELLDFVQRQVVFFRKVSVDNNGDKWWTYVDFYDTEDEDEELEGYDLAIKHLQTNFEERARLAMQLTVANIYDQAPWLVGDDLLALSDAGNDRDDESIKEYCLRDKVEFNRWQEIFYGFSDCGSDLHVAWLNDPDKTRRLDLKVTKNMLGERLFKTVRVIPLDVDKLACDLHKVPLGTDWRTYKPWVGVWWTSDDEQSSSEESSSEASSSEESSSEDESSSEESSSEDENEESDDEEFNGITGGRR